jgi:glycosyltransferase involved in cell wall biosynthesis
MDQQTKVLLLIPHLGGGGAEKVFTLLARELSSEKYDVHLGVICSTDPLPQSGFPNLTLHLLGASRVRSSALRVLTLVRRIKPRVILSGMFHLNFLVLLLRPLFPRSTRVLIRQNGFLSASLAIDKLPASTRLLYRLLYPRADRIICQTLTMANDLLETLKLKPEQLVVLPNPLDADALLREAQNSASKGTGTGPHLLAVGRLSREKGFDLLLDAFESVRQSFPAADLLIAGAGREEATLKAQCDALGLQQAIHFAGHIDRPSDYFPGATMFVLSSRHEGLPNALLEAAACGLPIVAVPAPGGIAELLRNQPGVWLAKEISSAALATSLQQALAALQPGQRFTHSFIEPFRMDRAVQAYEDFIDADIRDRQT